MTEAMQMCAERESTISRRGRKRQKHDELFKALLDTFLPRFLEIFFPWLLGDIDRDSIKAGSTQLIDVADLNCRHADLVYEAQLRDTHKKIFIHIEGQAQRILDYEKHVFMYNSRLYNNFHPETVVSIVVYGHAHKSIEPDKLQHGTSSFKVVDFNYLPLQLAKLDWHQYKNICNPIVAAMLSKMEYSSAEKIDVNLAHAKILAALDLSQSEVELIITYFETYLKLSPTEEVIFQKRLREELNQEEVEKMDKIFWSSYRWEGYRKGKAEGREEGRVEGMRELVAKLLSTGKLTTDDIKDTAAVPEELQHLVMGN